ncbi:MAG TPA: ABC transporter permease [Bryobacteraceae bacterium]|nr:ABC transporter permease [Bryobacteraceae bacterium]
MTWKYLIPRFRRREEADMQEELEALAEIAGRRELGNLALAAENARAVWGWTWIESLAADIRYAMRTLAANPAFTAMAALSLALGIGANTAIYSFTDAALVRSLPVWEPHRLAMLNWRCKDFPKVAHSFSGNNFKDDAGMTSGNFPFPAYEVLRSRSDVFDVLFAFNRAGRLIVQIRGQAEMGTGVYASGRFFSALGAPPAAGRLIDDDDDRPGAPPVVVFSFAYAERRFGVAARAVGQPVLLNNTPFTVIGVAAPGFYGLDNAEIDDIYLPLRLGPLMGESASRYQNSNSYWVQMMGRLRPGVSLAQAQSALAPMFQQFVLGTAANEQERKDLPALLVKDGGSGLETLRHRYSKALYVLTALAGLILLIACANLANLLLARAAARRKEIGMRLSLGAGRMRVVRQLLTESILLASLAGGLGVLFAAWGIHALTRLLANDSDTFTMHAELNWNVLGLALALSFATGLLFGLAPALQATRVDLAAVLKDANAGGPAPRRRWFFGFSMRRMLVVAQMAISVLLLVAAGLFARTLNNLNSVELGFNREHLLLFGINARNAGYKDAALAQFYQGLQTRLNAIPGVRSGTSSNFRLVSQSMSKTSIELDHPLASKEPNTAYMIVGPGFLTTMQIPLLAGREIDARDIATGAKVALVNQKFAKTFFDGENPVGRHFKLGKDEYALDLEIVGLARDTRYSSLKEAIPEIAYFSYTADLSRLYALTYELRAVGDPLALTSAVRRALQDADPRIPLSNLTTQSQTIDATIGQERTFAALCACFAALAVLIACVGLYGMIAYNVARRTGEIGMRMALGAGRGGLVWMIVREALALTAAGLAIGLPIALATSHVVKSFLFEMKPNDPLTLAAAGAILLAVAAAAGYAPAWRASRIDPWAALRHE